ncbi:hypothetical protein HK102_000105 [Quaeritorhiza haematococci]|nr:hypothetical protein HK102_000105 [Quaeritorhiza haematococci]
MPNLNLRKSLLMTFSRAPRDPGQSPDYRIADHPIRQPPKPLSSDSSISYLGYIDLLRWIGVWIIFNKSFLDWINRDVLPDSLKSSDSSLSYFIRNYNWSITLAFLILGRVLTISHRTRLDESKDTHNNNNNNNNNTNDTNPNKKKNNLNDEKLLNQNLFSASISASPSQSSSAWTEFSKSLFLRPFRYALPVIVVAVIQEFVCGVDTQIPSASEGYILRTLNGNATSSTWCELRSQPGDVWSLVANLFTRDDTVIAKRFGGEIYILTWSFWASYSVYLTFLGTSLLGSNRFLLYAGLAFFSWITIPYNFPAFLGLAIADFVHCKQLSQPQDDKSESRKQAINVNLKRLGLQVILLFVACFVVLFEPVRSGIDRGFAAIQVLHNTDLKISFPLFLTHQLQLHLILPPLTRHLLTRNPTPTPSTFIFILYITLFFTTLAVAFAWYWIVEVPSVLVGRGVWRVLTRSGFQAGRRNAGLGSDGLKSIIGGAGSVSAGDNREHLHAKETTQQQDGTVSQSYPSPPRSRSHSNSTSDVMSDTVGSLHMSDSTATLANFNNGSGSAVGPDNRGHMFNKINNRAQFYIESDRDDEDTTSIASSGFVSESSASSHSVPRFQSHRGDAEEGCSSGGPTRLNSTADFTVISDLDIDIDIDDTTDVDSNAAVPAGATALQPHHDRQHVEGPLAAPLSLTPAAMDDKVGAGKVKGKAKRLEFLEGIRGIAAILVLNNHFIDVTTRGMYPDVMAAGSPHYFLKYVPTTSERKAWG